MADTPKILAQLNPGSGVETVLYTVPSATNTVVSSLLICNQAASSATFSVRVNQANAANDPKQILYNSVSLGTNTTFSATIGITLAATDVVKVTANNANFSFNLFGTEIT